MDEAAIVVNGTPLTKAQSMTVRVALGSFLIDLGDEEHMAALGPIGPLYRARAQEVNRLLLRAVGPEDDKGGRTP